LKVRKPGLQIMDTHFLQVSYSHTGTQYIDITFSDMKLMVYV